MVTYQKIFDITSSSFSYTKNASTHKNNNNNKYSGAIIIIIHYL